MNRNAMVVIAGACLALYWMGKHGQHDENHNFWHLHFPAYCIVNLFSIFFQQRKFLAWKAGFPVAYQNFRNHYFRRPQPTVCLHIGKKVGCHRFKVKIDTLAPSVVKSHSCTMMALLNLAAPDWIQVRCSQRFRVQQVLCFGNMSKLPTGEQPKQVNKMMGCEKHQIFKDSFCYTFKWVSMVNRVEWEEQSQESIETLQNVEFLMFLFEAIDGLFPPFLICQETICNQRTFKKFLNIFVFYNESALIHNTEGFIVHKTKQQIVPCGENILQCQDNNYRSKVLSWNESKYILQQHYSSRCGPISEDFSPVLDHKRDHRSDEQCTGLFYKSLEGSYTMFMPLRHAQPHDSPKDGVSFLCQNGVRLDSQMENDLVADCGLEAEDEQTLKLYLLSLKEQSSCSNPFLIPCVQGHPRCFNITDVCVYKLDEFSHLSPCRTGGHLANCEQFDCNRNFKCTKSYCIPWSYVGDSKWDCPFGEDETKRCCSFKYHCNGTQQICLHLGNVCDREYDCPQREDEQLCELQHVKCPLNCHCLALGLLCQNSMSASLAGVYPYISVVFSDTEAFDMKHLLKYFPKSVFVVTRGCLLSSACGSHLNASIILLDLSDNIIPSFGKMCYYNLTRLKTLLLNNNLISMIETFSFVNLDSLTYISLSHNPLVTMHSLIFGNQSSIRLVRLNNLSLQNLQLDTFGEAQIGIIDTNDFHLYCILKAETKCARAKPWFTTCEDILPGISAEVVCFLVSALSLVVNSLCLVFHHRKRAEQRSFSLNVTSTTLSNLLCFLYLVTLSAANQCFKGMFVVKERQWRSAGFCFFTFFAILLFAFVAQFSLLLLSLTRLMVVVHPLDTKFKNHSHIKRCICMFSFPSVSFTLLITLIVAFIEKALSLSLCVPFADPNKTIIPLEITTWLVAITQTCSGLAMSVMHVVLVQKLTQSQKVVAQSKSKVESSNVSLVAQLISITTSNCSCWLVSNVIFVTLMYLPRYSLELVLWTTLAVVPLNSLANPVILLGFSIKCCR